MGLRDLVYGAYERRLARTVRAQVVAGGSDAPRSDGTGTGGVSAVPRHVGVMLDGNRRWARKVGTSTRDGHRAGADHIHDLLGWCADVGVEVVTLWLLSTDNLAREPAELAALFETIEDVVGALSAPGEPWRIHPVGALDLLPAPLVTVLKAATAATAGKPGLHVNVAVAYGGRHEITDAVRSLLLERARAGASLEEVAATLELDDIADHLYTRGQPDPDLVIRTSGEQRLSGFLLWQSVHSEFYVCDALWPEFRHVDFLRALRSYAQRQRRFGA